jgi:NAD(P)-dependent dehydrogenase (short-subunit alcohol dehydrogenase family)
VKDFGIHVTLIEPGGFSTDWGGPSAQHATTLPAYDGVREKSAQFRAARLAKQGDPQASGRAVLKLVDAAQPPLRVFFGDGPLGLATADYERRLEEWRSWEWLALESQG